MCSAHFSMSKSSNLRRDSSTDERLNLLLGMLQCIGGSLIADAST